MLTQQFHLRWQPTNAEYEEVLLARRKATKAIWGESISGALAIAFGMRAFLVGKTFDGVWFVVLGVVLATGLTISARGIVDISGGMRTETTWTFWKTWLLTPSVLALLTRPRGRTTVLVLARRGLNSGQDWDQLVSFVTANIYEANRADRNSSGT